MSKIINGLRDADNRKNGNGNGHTIHKAVSKSSEYNLKSTVSKDKGRIIKILYFLFILSLMGINIWQFLVIRGLYSDKENTISSLNRIEKLLSENSQQVNSVGTEVKRINSNLEAINTRVEIETKKISELKKDNDAQEFAINNLKKSKDTLFNRVNSLEVNIDKLKGQVSNRVAP